MSPINLMVLFHFVWAKMRRFEQDFTPFGFFTPWPHLFFRQLRNSLVYSTRESGFCVSNRHFPMFQQAQYILAVRLQRMPSKSDSSRLNPQGRLSLPKSSQSFKKDYPHKMEENQ